MRKRLDDVAQALGHAPAARRRDQEEILDAIERGEMTPREGIDALKALGNN